MGMSDFLTPLFMKDMWKVPTPEAQYRADFESRKPALGWTEENLKELIERNETIRPVEQRLLFRQVRSAMLRCLISASECADLGALVDVLRTELELGVPAAVPEWYVFSAVTMGRRRIGYQSCANRGCLKTEMLSSRNFRKCEQCETVYYCSCECHKADWKARHKHLCKSKASFKKTEDSVAKMFGLLSDASMAGDFPVGHDGLGSMLRASASSTAVAEYRSALEEEKHRGRSKKKKKGKKKKKK